MELVDGGSVINRATQSSLCTFGVGMKDNTKWVSDLLVQFFKKILVNFSKNWGFELGGFWQFVLYSLYNDIVSIFLR